MDSNFVDIDTETKVVNSGLVRRMSLLRFIFLVWCGSLVVVAIFFFLIHYFPQLTERFDRALNFQIGAPDSINGLVSPTVPTDAIFSPSGILLMNLSESEGSSKELFAYNFDTENLVPLPHGHMWPVESDDGAVGIGSRLFIENGDVSSGIFSIVDGKEVLVYASSSIEVLFANPKISMSGRYYTFSVPPTVELLENYDDRYDPSTWKIYFGDRTSSEPPQFIANGPSALFSPDETKLMYLAHDGFYLYDIISKTHTPLDKLSVGPHLTYLMIDISRDGKSLVLTNSPSKEVKVATVRSWSPFEIEWTKQFTMLAYWPVFSPSGEYIALMHFDWVNGKPGNRKVGVLEIGSGNIMHVADIDDYTDSDFYISDWVMN
jgi:hypothetical protein